MCGIVGYIGKRDAYPVLVKGLKRLEYRGYDSAGMALINGQDQLNVYKTKGRVSDLEHFVEDKDTSGSIGIAHTRWATHGEPSQVNAHPHYSSSGNLALIHNGIIENYATLKERLQQKGVTFLSNTDTEVLVQLIEYVQLSNKLDLLTALQLALHEVIGAYAIALLDRRQPDTILVARKSSPLVVGIGQDEFYFGSDATPIVEYTDKVVYLEDNEIAVMRRGQELKVVDLDNVKMKPEVQTIEMNLGQLDKGGYPHFMLKEMYEQPKAITDTFSPRLKNGDIVIDELGMSDGDIREIRKIMIVACGSAYHTGVTGKYVFEGLARIPVEVDLASEFRYRDPILDEGTLVVVISQSGETADSLAALREAKARGRRVLGIVNVVGSSIAREADNVMYTWAGPEIAVATTKAYSCQLIALYLLAMKFAKVRGMISESELEEMITELKKIPAQVEMLLNNKDRIQKFANRYLAAKNIFFIGRGIDYAISLEGSLKLKEISYIHSEAYAAGELKHGTISLIEDGTLVTALVTQEELYKKTISNIVEVKTRGAFVMAVTNTGNTDVEKAADYVVYIPKTNKYFANSLAIIPLQLFGYYVSVGRGCDVDKPRNLAKSVTVE